MHDEVETLKRQLAGLVRAANNLRTHTPDLWLVGWEHRVTDTEPDRGHFESSPPNAGNPKARRLFEQLAASITRMEAELVGYDRTMRSIFFAGTHNPEPTRGSTISPAEFARLKQAQERRRDQGGYAPHTAHRPAWLSGAAMKGHADLIQILWVVVLVLFIIVLLRQLGVQI